MKNMRIAPAGAAKAALGALSACLLAATCALAGCASEGTRAEDGGTTGIAQGATEADAGGIPSEVAEAQAETGAMRAERLEGSWAHAEGGAAPILEISPDGTCAIEVDGATTEASWRACGDGAVIEAGSEPIATCYLTDDGQMALSFASDPDAPPRCLQKASGSPAAR